MEAKYIIVFFEKKNQKPKHITLHFTVNNILWGIYITGIMLQNLLDKSLCKLT